MGFWITIIFFIIFLIILWNNLYAPYFKLRKLIKNKSWHKLAEDFDSNITSEKKLDLKFNDIPLETCREMLNKVQDRDVQSSIFPVLPLKQRMELEKHKDLWKKWFESFSDMSLDEILEKENSIIGELPKRALCELSPILYILEHAEEGSVKIYGTLDPIKNKGILTITGIFLDKRSKKKMPVYFSIVYDKKAGDIYLANPLTT